jgi:hypothetical protein
MRRRWTAMPFEGVSDLDDLEIFYAIEPWGPW